MTIKEKLVLMDEMERKNEERLEYWNAYNGWWMPGCEDANDLTEEEKAENYLKWYEVFGDEELPF